MTSAQLTQDPALERLLVRIVEVMQPLEVWLFGSRAEGRHREDSDYDVLVVLPDSVPDEALDPVAAWRVARDARVAADIVPCRYSEFQDERDEIDTLARAATHRGRKLFER